MRSGSYCYACSGCGPAVRSEIMTTMATSAQHSIVVDVPAHAFYEVITDFARYPEYLTSVTAVDILRHQGNEWDVAFNVRVLRNIDYTVRHVGVPAQSLSWTLLEPGYLIENEGGWRLEPTGPAQVTAHYEVAVSVSRFVPASIQRQLVQVTLPEVLKEWKLHAEARYQKSIQGDES